MRAHMVMHVWRKACVSQEIAGNMSRKLLLPPGRFVRAVWQDSGAERSPSRAKVTFRLCLDLAKQEHPLRDSNPQSSD